MIKAQDLIDKFRYALDERWGYIWGTAGVLWTDAKQKQKISYMIKNFGANWKINKDAEKSNYYSAALYGEKWVGHMVADCSGLFAWAFKELGGKIAHGSNSIYDRYCTKKGKLTGDLKKTLLPGTAVLTGNESTHGHIGLYVGGGKVIEASGTQAGVCTSNLSAGKWTYYGQLKNVDYSAVEPPETPSSGEDDKQEGDMLPTLRKGSKGKYVTLLQTKLMNQGYNLGKYGVDGDFGSATLAAVKEFQRDHGLAVDGVVGAKTWAALETDAPVELYSVVIPHLTKADAEKLVKTYTGAFIETEKG